MSKVVEILSPNIIRHKEFRRQLPLNAATSSDEAFAVARQALLVADVQRIDEENMVILTIPKSEDEMMEQRAKCDLDRKDLEIKSKLFLKDFSEEAIDRALTLACQHVASQYLDSLQLAVPLTGSQWLAIAEEAKQKDGEYKVWLQKLVDLWHYLETQVDKGLIKSIGLCDVELQTLKEVYDKAIKKPNSITINLTSCCTVPTDLQEFANNKGLRLLTHNDSELILDDSKLGQLRADAFAEVKWDFVIRYQVMDVQRGVLQDKRYILGLKGTPK